MPSPIAARWTLPLLCWLAAASAQAQAPHLLGYQGRLVRSDGTAATGTASVTFSIFALEAGGSALWWETQTLGLSDGYYATFLGLVSPPSDAVFEGGVRWLEVRVGSETLSPRQQIGAAAYAFTARSVAGGHADVASLTVAGQTVIDADGRLAGSARYAGGPGIAVDDASQTIALQSCAAGQGLVRDGSAWQCAVAGTVTAVSAAAPLSVAGANATPALSIAQAGSASSGYLSSVDWTSFSAKLGPASQCGGDLSGTLAAPVVARLQSRQVSTNAPAAGQVLKWTGAQWEPAADANGGGTVTSVTALPPLTAWYGSTTPELSLAAASASTDGYLASADWVRFGAKYDAATQCGGDLGGALASPEVAKIRGIPVASTIPAGAQVLRYDGSAWSPASLLVSDVGGLSSGYVDLSGAQTLGGTKTFTEAPVFGAPLGVASGGTGATAFAPGGVVFGGASGGLSQSAGLRWDPSGRLGIGTDAPGAPLHVDGAIRAQQLCDTTGANCKTVASGWDLPPSIVALADAPTIAVDAAPGTVFQVTLGGDRIMGAPTGAVPGQLYTVWITQDSTGGHSLAWGSSWEFSGNSIVATAPGARSAAFFTWDGSHMMNLGGHNLSGIVPFNFTNASGVGVSAIVESNAVALSGISGAVLASITGPGSPALSVNNGAWTTTSSVTAGDSLRVRAASSATVLTTTSELVVVGGYTTSWSITTTTNPGAFGWSNVLGAAWSAVVESGAATPAGYTGALPVSVAGDGGPELSVNGGAWAASGTIAPGQTLALRLTSAGAAATTRTATLAMGSYQTAWSVTTTANPGAFSFANVPGAAWNVLVESDSVVPSGHTGPLAVSVSGDGSPEISIDGGAWATSGTLLPDQALRVHLASANAASTARAATVVVGSISSTWTVTSSASPATFTFGTPAAASWNTLTTSGAVTPTGHTGAVPVSVSGAGSPQISINGSSTWVTSGTLGVGQTLAVRLTSASAANTGRTATVTAGSTSVNWTVTTTTDPSSFSFSNVTGVLATTATTSATVTPTGYSAPLTVSVTGAGSPQLSINGSTTWVASGTISQGQTLAVKLTSGVLGATNTATITMGGFQTTWSVTTASSYGVVVSGGARQWLDGTYAASCAAYMSPSAPYSYSGSTGDGLYTVNPGGTGAFQAWCDQTLDGGGWALVTSVASQGEFWRASNYTVATGARTVSLGTADPTQNYVMALPQWKRMLAQSGTAAQLRKRVRTIADAELTMGRLVGLQMDSNYNFTADPTAVYNRSGTNVGAGSCIIQYTNQVSQGLYYSNFNEGDNNCTGFLGFNGFCGYPSMGHAGDYVGSGTSRFSDPCSIDANYYCSPDYTSGSGGSFCYYKRKWFYIK